MTSVVTNILKSQIISFLYAFSFMFFVTVIISLDFPVSMIFLGIVIMGGLSFTFCYRRVLDGLPTVIASIIPYIPYTIIVLFLIGMLKLSGIEDDDYGSGIYLLFGTIISWISIIIGSVAGYFLQRDIRSH